MFYFFLQVCRFARVNTGTVEPRIGPVFERFRIMKKRVILMSCLNPWNYQTEKRYLKIRSTLNIKIPFFISPWVLRGCLQGYLSMPLYLSLAPCPEQMRPPPQILRLVETLGDTQRVCVNSREVIFILASIFNVCNISRETQSRCP